MGKHTRKKRRYTQELHPKKIPLGIEFKKIHLPQLCKEGLDYAISRHGDGFRLIFHFNMITEKGEVAITEFFNKKIIPYLDELAPKINTQLFLEAGPNSLYFFQWDALVYMFPQIQQARDALNYLVYFIKKEFQG